MIAYASHYAWLVILIAIVHLTNSSRPESIALKCLLVWNLIFTTLACAWDINYLKYSTMSIKDVKVKVDIKACFYLFIIAILNVAVCTATTTITRLCFGMNILSELGVASTLLLVYNAANIWWDLQPDREDLRQFYARKGLDLDKHMIWSLFLSNTGLSFRVYKRVISYTISMYFFPDLMVIPYSIKLMVWAYFVLALAADIRNRGMLGVFVAAEDSKTFCFFNLFEILIPTAMYQFHSIHLYVHSKPSLYVLIHKIHHFSRYPIPSDSGTESPIEFLFTEYNVLSLCLPLSFWAFHEARKIIIHRIGHNYQQDPANYHVLHHCKNTGNYSYPKFDSTSGTQIEENTEEHKKK